MCFRRLGLFIVFVFIKSIVFSQNTLSGKIIDAATDEPLAFATVKLTSNRSFTTLTDIDGYFSFNISAPIKNISISYLGYKTKVLYNFRDKDFPLVIKLKQSLSELGEVIVTAGENPANKVIRKVIKNKALNNPANLSSFLYYSYNKTIFDTANKDSLDLFQNSHLFMMESVTRRKYKKPDLSEETIIGTKVSGFKNPKFAALATEFQPFSFYEDVISLYDIDYLNPISKGSLARYKFEIKDTLYTAQDSVYVIAFEPQPNKNFQGLKGSLHINTNHYAIQNVIASPAEKGKINISIQQQYKFINKQHWFPHQLNYQLVFSMNPNEKDEIFVEGKSYIDSVQFNLPFKRKEFSLKSVRLKETAAKKDRSFWNTYRPSKLDSVALKTYRVLDSLGQKYKLDKFFNVFYGIVDQKIPIGFIDLDLSKTIIYNRYEGFRLGTGLYTNDKVSEKFTFGGFFGYGLKDNAWKYGGKVDYHPSERFSVSAGYENDLTEVGKHKLSAKSGFFGFRRYIASRFDSTKKYYLRFDFIPARYLSVKINLETSKTTPKYEYSFLYNNRAFKEYNNSAITFNLRYAYGEKTLGVLEQQVKQQTFKYPIVEFSYTRGIENIFKSNWSYNKFELGLKQSFYTRGLGTSNYNIKSGIIENTVPYGLLFTGNGSLDDKIPIIMKNHFQTMYPYEFLSDSYVNVFLTHDFGGLLFKAKNFQPNLILHQNLGLGSLSLPKQHQFVNYKSLENKAYLETGLQIDNLLKLNYLDLGYLGFGVAGFYRYGYHSLSDFNDNFALKATVGFTIK